MRHAAHASSVLEEHSIPVALRVIEYCSLGHSVFKASERSLEDDLLLVRTFDIVSAVAYLSADSASWPGNHQQIVPAVFLDHAASLEKIILLTVTLEKFRVKASVQYACKVRLELSYLPCAVNHVCLAVIIKEEGCIVKMRYHGMELPFSARVFSCIYITFIRLVIRGEISVESAVMVA